MSSRRFWRRNSNFRAIEPRGKHRITTLRDKYSGIRNVGPNSLRHFKRSFKEALKRQIMIGDYDPQNPVIIPQKKDIRYRSWKEVKSPQSNAVIIFMMDVSGSMGEEQKRTRAAGSFWIDTWLRKITKALKAGTSCMTLPPRKWTSTLFIICVKTAGPKSAALFEPAKRCSSSIIRPMSGTSTCFISATATTAPKLTARLHQAAQGTIAAIANMFGYCQVASAYGSGNFINVLHEHLPEP